MSISTPIYDFVKQYADGETIRFHMPGHKGNQRLGPERLDITEIKGADALFCADGIIAESEKNAAEIFHTAKTLYSTCGSTLCIQTMVFLAAMGVKNPKIIAARNAHVAFINACALCGCEIEWVYPKYSGSICSGDVSADLIEKALENTENPCAVYITSPDYLGKTYDIASIAEICRNHGVPLIVDNAHGAYLKFMKKSRHPIDLGADMCCDSAHKTLPVLTPGAYLHISELAPKRFSENAKKAMSLFSTTSPSYLTLCSLDLCNKELSEDYSKKLETVCGYAGNAKRELSALGYRVYGDERLKISLYTLDCGLTGDETAQRLRMKNIECEYSDYGYVVLMPSADSKEEDFKRLVSALSFPMPKIRLMPTEFEGYHPKQALSPREAAFSCSETVDIENAVGRVCAKTVTACPPGVPIAVSGELIDENVVKIMKRYSFLTADVIK